VKRRRASVIVIRGNQVALMERWRDQHHYFVAPGGGVEPGETPEQAAVREAREELGFDITIAETIDGFFLASTSATDFGPMTGPEQETATNRYRRVWVDVDEAAALTILTPGLKEVLADLHRPDQR
jgi:8-oxo-dGTP pyrophosphatase MutT (NUDIX family)